MKAKICFALLQLIFLISPALYAFGQNQKTASIFETLTRTENAKFVLTTNLLELMENRSNEEYHTGFLQGPDGKKRQIKVRVRGKYRRRICELPPLKIKFDKGELAAEGLSEMNELKLVTACKNDKKSDGWITKEHAAYSMFQTLTPASFRARLVTVLFKDIHVENVQFEMQCMILEDMEELCARLGVSEVEAFGLNPEDLHTKQAALVCMFNYMIGNTDWEVSGARNVKFVRSISDPNAKILVIPYDFDFSGLVNTDYASPASFTGLKNVRERFLINDGLPHEELRRAAMEILNTKEKIMAAISSKNISRGNQTDMREFLEPFFETLAANTASFLMASPVYND